MVARRLLPGGVATHAFSLVGPVSTFLNWGPFEASFLVDELHIVVGDAAGDPSLSIRVAALSDRASSNAEIDAGTPLTLDQDDVFNNIVLPHPANIQWMSLPLYYEVAESQPFVCARLSVGIGTSQGFCGLHLRSQAHRRAVELALEDVRELLGER